MIDLSLDHRVILNSEFDAGLQELDLLFNTETTELINDPTFGTNFEQFLWQLTPATSALKKYIIEADTENIRLDKALEMYMDKLVSLSIYERYQEKLEEENRIKEEQEKNLEKNNAKVKRMVYEQPV